MPTEVQVTPFGLVLNVHHCITHRANFTVCGIILWYYPSNWKEEGKIIVQGHLFPSLDLNPVFLNVNVALLTSVMQEQTVLDLSKL